MTTFKKNETSKVGISRIFYQSMINPYEVGELSNHIINKYITDILDTI